MLLFCYPSIRLTHLCVKIQKEGNVRVQSRNVLIKKEEIESHWMPFLEKMQEEEEMKKKLLSI